MEKIVVGVIAILYIVFMWIKKDIIAIYTTVPDEQILTMIVTTVAVSLLKVAAVAGVVLLVKWIVGKVKK